MNVKKISYFFIILVAALFYWVLVEIIYHGSTPLFSVSEIYMGPLFHFVNVLLVLPLVFWESKLLKIPFFILALLSSFGVLIMTATLQFSLLSAGEGFLLVYTLAYIIIYLFVIIKLLKNDFEGGRHEARIKKIEDLEK